MSVKVPLPNMTKALAKPVPEKKPETTIKKPANSHDGYNKLPEIQEMADFELKTYEEVYNELLSTISEVSKSEHPDITDYEWAIRAFGISYPDKMSVETKAAFNSINIKLQGDKKQTKPSNCNVTYSDVMAIIDKEIDEANNRIREQISKLFS